MFPFYYGGLPDSKTAFVFLLAQVYPEVVSFESYNGEFNGKCITKFNILKKAFSDGFFCKSETTLK